MTRGCRGPGALADLGRGVRGRAQGAGRRRRQPRWHARRDAGAGRRQPGRGWRAAGCPGRQSAAGAAEPADR